MVTNVYSNTWGKVSSRSKLSKDGDPKKERTPTPRSSRAATAAQTIGVINTPDYEESTEVGGTAAPLIPKVIRRFQGKLPNYTVLYPLVEKGYPPQDYQGVATLFANGGLFYANKLPTVEELETVQIVDQYNFKDGDFVILAYGRRYTWQRWFKVRG